MTLVSHQRLEFAVASLCPQIKERVDAFEKKIDERQLWWELSCCIASNQVPYQIALGAADAIQNSRLLLEGNTSENILTNELTLILRQPLCYGSGFRRYRLSLRARQLSATRAAVVAAAGSLLELVLRFEDALVAREWFVKNAPGLGPKQASMFDRTRA